MKEDIEEELDHKNHRYELEDDPKKHPNRILIPKELETKVIIYCRKTVAHKIRARLWLKQYDVSLIKELSVLMKIKSSFY